MIVKKDTLNDNPKIGTLKKYLGLNALFSGINGLIMLVAKDYLNSLFNIQNAYVFPILGINLIGFALFVLFVAFKKIRHKGLVNLISVLDGFWVLGSSIILAFSLFELSSIGYALIGLVAICVGFLGYKQFQNNT